MKRAVRIFVGMVFCIGILAGTAVAAEKFATVDLAKVFGEYKKTKTYEKSLGDKESAYFTEMDKKANELKGMQEKLSLLSEKEQAAKKGEFESKINAFKEFRRQKETDLRKEQDQKMQELLKDIEGAIKQYSEKQGFTLVFSDRMLAYKIGSLDITEQVIAILNGGAATTSSSTPTKK